VLNDLRWEEAISFVNIGGIVDHNFLNLLFIILLKVLIVRLNKMKKRAT